MARQLKCPRCRQKQAWIEYGVANSRRYKQKFCFCGYQGKRRYWGQPVDREEVRRSLGIGVGQ